MLRIKNTFNQLFDGKSLDNRATLSQLKNDFHHRSVSTDVMSCFNYAENFLRFLTETHIVYLALKLCNMDIVDAEPSGVDVKMPGEIVICSRLSTVISFIWLLPTLTNCISLSQWVSEQFLNGTAAEWKRTKRKLDSENTEYAKHTVEEKLRTSIFIPVLYEIWT